ncbi:M15 family metallopeptidase [Pseudogulbenkiania sp. MAI-1]|uniref:M15 family metallopeptidase n=1 Tax=Pseudogulbenkiania sp. MAI-1 TaxID=990370 RepID=UPI0004ADBA33|nr:M15 family metallopeptidase [Pseudogulbenkiania sp. MAI-1]
MLLICLISWIGLRFFNKKILSNEIVIEETNVASTTQAADIRAQDPRQETPSGTATMRQTKSEEHTKKYFVIARIPLVSLSLAAMPVVLDLFFREMHGSSEFIPNEYTHSSRIKLTLQEEQLVPPPPLPPEAFRDAISEQPRLNRADRDWNKLDASFVQTVLHVMTRLEARGYPMTLLEGYRSPERQDALAEQGTLVTKAKGGQSKHQYGLAVDLAPVRNGKVVISERDPWAMSAYLALGEEATAAGLTWGGNWSFKDYGHIERSGSLKQLLARQQ